MTKDTRIIFDKNFYTLQAILNSKKFKGLSDKFYFKLEKAGVPIPMEGFKTVKELDAWDEIARKKNIYYPGMIDDILDEFNVVQSKDKIRLGLSWYFYHGKKKAPIQFTYSQLFEIADDKKSLNVSLTIFPWTTKQDVMGDLWERIEMSQKELVDYRGNSRNREWITFERDLKIYELYLNLKKKKTKTIYLELAVHPKFKKIAKEFKAGESIEESVSPIVSKCRRYLSGINLI
jgi:hypothetical protein